MPLSSDLLGNAFDGWGLTAGEWRSHGDQAGVMLDNMARMLNSNEQFGMDDSFQLAFVHVRRPPVGTGKEKK